MQATQVLLKPKNPGAQVQAVLAKERIELGAHYKQMVELKQVRHLEMAHAVTQLSPSVARTYLPEQERQALEVQVVQLASYRVQGTQTSLVFW